jgi:hypothetical protein
VFNRDARRRAFVEREITRTRLDQQRYLDQVLTTITHPRFRRDEEWLDLSEVSDTYSRAFRSGVVIDTYLDELSGLIDDTSRG